MAIAWQSPCFSSILLRAACSDPALARARGVQQRLGRGISADHSVQPLSPQSERGRNLSGHRPGTTPMSARVVLLRRCSPELLVGSAAPPDPPNAADTIDVAARSGRRRSPSPAGRARSPPLSTAPDPLSERSHRGDLGAAQVGPSLAMTPYVAAPHQLEVHAAARDAIAKKEILQFCFAPPAATRPSRAREVCNKG